MRWPAEPSMAIITVRLEQARAKKAWSPHSFALIGTSGLIRGQHPFAGKSGHAETIRKLQSCAPLRSLFSHRSRVDDWLLRQEVVPGIVQRCTSYVSAVAILQSTNHMMVGAAPGRRIHRKKASICVLLRCPADFTPFELCYLTHPNAQFDPAKQWLKKRRYSRSPATLTYTGTPIDEQTPNFVSRRI